MFRTIAASSCVALALVLFSPLRVEARKPTLVDLMRDEANWPRGKSAPRAPAPLEKRFDLPRGKHARPELLEKLVGAGHFEGEFFRSHVDQRLYAVEIGLPLQRKDGSQLRAVRMTFVDEKKGEPPRPRPGSFHVGQLYISPQQDHGVRLRDDTFTARALRPGRGTPYVKHPNRLKWMRRQACPRPGGK